MDLPSLVKRVRGQTTGEMPSDVPDLQGPASHFGRFVAREEEGYQGHAITVKPGPDNFPVLRAKVGQDDMSGLIPTGFFLVVG